MREAFFSVAALGFLYYIVIIWHTKNWRATFSLFWVGFGIVQIVMGIVIGKLPKWSLPVLQVLFCLSLIVFMAIEILIASGMLSMPVKNIPVIIVLGACVRGEQITGCLKRRLDKALRYLYDHPETIVIVSGGKGRGEDVSEAVAMREYLRSQDLPDERILIEDQSRTTKENLEYSKKFIKNEEQSIGIVTNNFHMYRALRLAKNVGYKHVYGIPASSDAILFLNYMVREFFAVLWISITQFQKRRKEQIDK